MRASTIVQDTRTLSTILVDTNKRYKLSDWETYQNRALKDIVKDKLTESGDGFGDVIPELVKTSGLLTQTGGILSKPTDAWRAIGLRAPSSNAVFERILSQDVTKVIAGRSLVTPSTARPVFYEEIDVIKILPVSFSPQIELRYIVSLEDLTVRTGTLGPGNFNTANGTFTVLTRALSATMNIPFTANDVNKLVTFRDGITVYHGKIESFVDASTVVLVGDELPVGNLTVLHIMVVDSAEDIPLNPVWDGEIIKRMVDMAKADESRNVTA